MITVNSSIHCYNHEPTFWTAIVGNKNPLTFYNIFNFPGNFSFISLLDSFYDFLIIKMEFKCLKHSGQWPLDLQILANVASHEKWSSHLCHSDYIP